MKQYYPNYELKVFVEDLYRFSNEESDSNYGYEQIDSALMAKEHQEYLAGDNVEICYFGAEKSRVDRIRAEVEAVTSFNPECIIAFSADFSIPRAFLYSYYPILDWSLGGMSNSAYGDMYIVGQESDSLDNYFERYNMLMSRNQVHNLIMSIGFLPAMKDYKRSDFAIAENAFVMVTVGNRLSLDLGEDFCDLIVSFLKKRSNCLWILVGIKDHLYLEQTYPELMGRQILFHLYEGDLAAFYRICDVFVNPLRVGGGFSIGSAMQEGVPIVTHHQSEAGLSFMGSMEECVTTDLEYIDQLERLYLNREYREERGQYMRSLLERRQDEQATMAKSIQFIKMAQEHWRQRAANS